ncbi:unnamed protein product [Urochloa humidicola]
MVQKPKEKGGLGVINLRIQNDALLLKHMHKFYTKRDIPWVKLIWSTYYIDKVPHAAREVGSFWWKDVWRLNTLFRGIARCHIGDGSTALFWDDLWTTQILAEAYPRLYSYVTDHSLSVKDVIQAPDLASIFSLPLSNEAYAELQELNEFLENFVYDPDVNDSWTFIWGSNEYSANRLYKFAFAGVQVPRTFTWIWKSKCTPRLKFFAWLLIVDRLNTRDMLLRRRCHLQSGAQCVMCDQNVVEDRDHLFFDCPFADHCWELINIDWPTGGSIHERFVAARNSASIRFFTEIFIVAAWEIWKLRNAVIFEGERATHRLWTFKFKEQIKLQLLRVREDHRPIVIQWLNNVM